MHSSVVTFGWEDGCSGIVSSSHFICIKPCLRKKWKALSQLEKIYYAFISRCASLSNVIHDVDGTLKSRTILRAVHYVKCQKPLCELPTTTTMYVTINKFLKIGMVLWWATIVIFEVDTHFLKSKKLSLISLKNTQTKEQRYEIATMFLKICGNDFLWVQ